MVPLACSKPQDDSQAPACLLPGKLPANLTPPTEKQTNKGFTGYEDCCILAKHSRIKAMYVSRPPHNTISPTTTMRSFHSHVFMKHFLYTGFTAHGFSRSISGPQSSAMPLCCVPLRWREILWCKDSVSDEKRRNVFLRFYLSIYLSISHKMLCPMCCSIAAPTVFIHSLLVTIIPLFWRQWRGKTVARTPSPVYGIRVPLD